MPQGTAEPLSFTDSRLTVSLTEKRRRQRVRKVQLTAKRGQVEEIQPSDFKAQADEHRAAPLCP